MDGVFPAQLSPVLCPRDGGLTRFRREGLNLTPTLPPGPSERGSQSESDGTRPPPAETRSPHLNQHLAVGTGLPTHDSLCNANFAELVGRSATGLSGCRTVARTSVSSFAAGQHVQGPRGAGRGGSQSSAFCVAPLPSAQSPGFKELKIPYLRC